MRKTQRLVIAFTLSALPLAGCSQRPGEAEQEEHPVLNGSDYCGDPAVLARPAPDRTKPPVIIDYSLDGLINHSGEAVADASFRGRVLVLYFGYPECKTVCPPALEAIRGALAQHNRPPVTPVLITSAPGYTAQQLRIWLQESGLQDHNGAVLSGDAARLQALYTAFYVTGPHGQHSPRCYFIGPDGTFLDTILAHEEELIAWMRDNIKTPAAPKPPAF